MVALPEYTLSPEQQAAVDSQHQAIVVVASAGSGKTEVAARRVERLLSGGATDGFRVLALSYTVKAADELKGRFRDRLRELHRRVDTDTVHGLAHSLLRQYGTRIGLPVEPEVLVRDEDRAELLARWLAAEGRAVPEDLVGVLQRLDLARARREGSALLDDWEAALANAGALDYASMLVRAVELLRLPSARRQVSRLYGHVIVDEAQNLTPAQYELLTALIGPPDGSEHLPTVLVGDDKQSIVSFAGADPHLIRRFEAEYNAVRFELRQNFRSAAMIASVGDFVARRLTPEQKPIAAATSYAAPGLVRVYEAGSELEEANFVARWVQGIVEGGLPEEALAQGENPAARMEDIAVLARSAAALAGTRSAIEAVGLKAAAASSPDDWLASLAGNVVLELVALKSASDHRSTHWQLSRLLDVPEDQVLDPYALSATLASHWDPTLRMLAPLCSAETLSELIEGMSAVAMPSDLGVEQLAAWESDTKQIVNTWLSFSQQNAVVEQTWGNFRLHVSRQQRGTDLDSGIRLLTIHKAQGREFRAVALVGLNDGQLPDFRAKTGEERLSELRTFYVAVTRASRLLLITRPRSRETRYGPRSADASPYLEFVRTAV